MINTIIILNILLYITVFIFGMVIFSLGSEMVYVGLHDIKIKNFRKVFLIPLFKNNKMKAKYILIPVFGGVMSVLNYLKFENNIEIVFNLLFFCILTAVSIVDIYKMEIPNEFVILLGIVGIVSAFFLKDITAIDRFIGFFAASIPLFLVALLVNGGFGGGDIKLMAVAGIFLGWKLTLISTFIGIIVGGIYGTYVLITRKKTGKDHFAFGPCLSIGMIICTFYGNEIINWMFNTLDFSAYFM